MGLETYKDFAENDYQYYTDSVKAGFVANMMGAIAQGICEKYMKHLIDEYYEPQNEIQQNKLDQIMITHSLPKLMKFLRDEMDIEFSRSTRTKMNVINGFYFSARYPGDNSIILDSDDISDCTAAVEACRSEFKQIEYDIEHPNVKTNDIGDDDR